jgi:hypothetical protein
MVTGVLTAAFPRLMSRDQHAPLSRWLHRAFGLGLAIIGWTQLP